MSELNKKLYKNVAALILFVIFLAVIIVIVRGALPLWAFVGMVAIAVILCGVFAYRTIQYCAELKKEQK